MVQTTERSFATGQISTHYRAELQAMLEAINTTRNKRFKNTKRWAEPRKWLHKERANTQTKTHTKQHPVMSISFLFILPKYASCSSSQSSDTHGTTFPVKYKLQTTCLCVILQCCEPLTGFIQQMVLSITSITHPQTTWQSSADQFGNPVCGLLNSQLTNT